MGVPKPAQFSTPTRSVSEYTVGKADNKPDLSTAATSPTVGGLAANPQFIQTIGMTSKQINLAAVSLAANTYGQLVTNTFVDLPGLLPNNDTITFGDNDQVFIFAQGVIGFYPAPMSLGTIIITPYGTTTKRVRIAGPFLPTDIEYVGFGVSIIVYATPGGTAVPANSVVGLRIDAMLLDLPG